MSIIDELAKTFFPIDMFLNKEKSNMLSPVGEAIDQDKVGYDVDKEELVTFFQGNKITVNREGRIVGYNSINACARLVDVDDTEKIVTMLRTNIDKAKEDQEEEKRKEEEYSRKIEPHIQASQKLDEILGS